jgi:hypothetical protein
VQGARQRPRHSSMLADNRGASVSAHRLQHQPRAPPPCNPHSRCGPAHAPYAHGASYSPACTAASTQSLFNTDLIPNQVAARDAFGNPCSAPAHIRCKLVCSSSDGAPVFVEACDAVVVQPFLPPASLRGVAQSHVQPPPLHTPHTETPAAAANVRQQQHGGVQTGLFLPDLGAASDNDDSVVGDVDIGRYECDLKQNVGCAVAAPRA